MWFGWGIAVTVVAMSLAYLTNYATVEHAYAELGSKAEKRAGSIKDIAHVTALAAAALSLGLFVFGLHQVRSAITTLLY
jgi:hypothetical protein